MLDKDQQEVLEKRLAEQEAHNPFDTAFNPNVEGEINDDIFLRSPSIVHHN